MTAQEYLQQIRNLDHKINCMKARADYYDRMSLSIPGPSYGEKIGSNPNRNLEAPFVKWIMKKDELDREIAKQEGKLVALKAEVALQVEEIKDENLKSLLILRYFQFKSWNEIAKTLYVARATVFRWHDLALASIEVPAKVETQ